MKPPHTKLLAIIIVIGTFSYCRTRSSDSELQWGHLADQDLIPASPAYLINKTTTGRFKVCLAKYMMDSFPGIQTEIQSAVNIWAFYLGRTIPVDITIKDLPRANTEDTALTLADKYYELCGSGFDTVVGLSPLSGNIVGQTSFNGQILVDSSGTRTLVSFKRHLFLRDYSLTPNPDPDSFSGWETYQTRTGKTFTGDQLLKLMTGRDQLSFSTKNKLLTLTTITHEIGHIWGLCDQYESSSNCDPVHSSSHKVLDSLMGSAVYREKIYLTDDDIEGIRALAARAGFLHDWQNKNGGLTAVPKPIVSKAVENFEPLSYVQNGNNLVISMSLVTTVPSKIMFEIKSKNSNLWQQGSMQESPARGFDWPHLTSTLTLPSGDHPKYDVRVNLFIKNGQDYSSAGMINFSQP